MIKKQRGVTIIELLIAMVLGLSLVGGIGQLFVQSQKSFRLQRNLSDMTDDAAFLLESLAKGVLLAGFTDEPNYDSFPQDLNISHVTGIPDISLNAGEFIHGTNDQLVYRYKLGSSPYTNNGNCASVRSSCELDNFVGTSELNGNKGEMVTIRIYKANAKINNITTPVFYSKTKITPIDPNAEPTIFDAQPLISEVEKLEFKYGIRDTKGTSALNDDSFYYTTADNVTDWTQVFAVKVFLVIRSADDNLVRSQTGYKIDGTLQEPVPTNRRVYKTFSKTIFLRAISK